MPRPYDKTPTKRTASGSGVRRCGACGNRVGANDKFCTGCGVPVSAPGKAPGAPQRTRKSGPDAKTLRAKKRRFKNKARRAKKKRFKAVPNVVPQKPNTAPQTAQPDSQIVPAASQTSGEYLANPPERFSCPNCNEILIHGTYVSCPVCEFVFEYCEHLDGKRYDPKDCYNHYGPGGVA